MECSVLTGTSVPCPPPSKAQRSLQTAELAEEIKEIGVAETAGNRCFADTTEPLSQELTAAATVGTRLPQIQPARIPSIVTGCSQSPTPLWGVILINGWEKYRFFYGDVAPERPPLFHRMASICLRMHQQHWVGSVVYFFFKVHEAWKGTGGHGRTGERGSSEFDQSTRYACLELSN